MLEKIAHPFLFLPVISGIVTKHLLSSKLKHFLRLLKFNFYFSRKNKNSLYSFTKEGKLCLSQIVPDKWGQSIIGTAKANIFSNTRPVIIQWEGKYRSSCDAGKIRKTRWWSWRKHGWINGDGSVSVGITRHGV